MKSWFQSKTVWFNVVVTLIELGSFFQTAGLSSHLVPYAIGLQGVGNVILRIWFTNTGIGTPPSGAVNTSPPPVLGE